MDPNSGNVEPNNDDVEDAFQEELSSCSSSSYKSDSAYSDYEEDFEVIESDEDCHENDYTHNNAVDFTNTDSVNDEVEEGEEEEEEEDVFNAYYAVYSFSHAEKSHLEAGNKIVLPESTLARLMKIGVACTMMFKLENPITGQTSHCGVLEFSSEEGVALMPDWMMDNIGLEQNGLVNLESVVLKRATFVKLQPHSMKFSDIQNPKDVLEAVFCGGYSCLTVGDTILITNEGDKFYVDVIDAKPASAVSMIETDVEVDFALALDYKPPTVEPTKLSEDATVQKSVFFSGRARRLNESNTPELTPAANAVNLSQIVSKDLVSIRSSEGKMAEQNSEAFSGKSYRLMDS